MFPGLEGVVIDLDKSNIDLFPDFSLLRSALVVILFCSTRWHSETFAAFRPQRQVKRVEL